MKTDNTLGCLSVVDPQTIPQGSFNQVSSGPYYNCAIKTDGSQNCWGGFATPPEGTFSQVSSGTSHACAIKSDGDVACWGDEEYGKTAAPGFKNRVAAYVCNHLGPQSGPQYGPDAVPNNTPATDQDVNTAIAHALNSQNEVACVAMDYQTPPGGGKPYVRFYVFAPNGQLALSINLDGRQEKYVPGTCVACHGGDQYDGHFPSNSGSPDIGGHFLPYDVGNFRFATDQPGLSKADQQVAIHELNKIVLKTNPTSIERNLINAWYHSGDSLDEEYWPSEWQDAAANDPDNAQLIEHLYKDVHARYCRTCHVAINRDGMGRAGTTYDNPEFFEKWYRTDNVGVTVCGGTTNIHNNHTMPNSLVTFNLMWNDANAVSYMHQKLGDDCTATLPDPQLLPTPPPQ